MIDPDEYGPGTQSFRRALQNRSATTREALDLSKQIQVILEGKGPIVQGATLIDLVSLWLAGHKPSIRDAVLDNWVKAVKRIVPISEEQIFVDRAKPEGWDD